MTFADCYLCRLERNASRLVPTPLSALPRNLSELIEMDFCITFVNLSFILLAVSAHPNNARRRALAERGSKRAFDMRWKEESEAPANLAAASEPQPLVGPGGYAGYTFQGSNYTQASAVITVPIV